MPNEIVGRAFVEIIPDFRRFIRKLRRDLAKSMASIQQESDRGANEMIKSFDRASQQIKESNKSISTQLKSDFKESKKEIIDNLEEGGEQGGKKLRTVLDKSLEQIRRDLKGFKPTIVGEFSNISTRIGKDFNSQTNAMFNSFNKDLTTQTKKAEKSWAVFLKNANVAYNQFVKDQAKANFQGLRQSFKRLQQEAKQSGERIGKTINNSIADGLKGSQGRAKAAFQNILDLFVTGPEVRLFLSKLGSNIILIAGGLAAAAAQAISQTVIAPILVALGSSLAFLPGVIAGVAASFFVLRAATSNLGQAFKFLAKEDAPKFQEAIKKLAPTAREFAIEIRNLVSTLRPLQQALQNAFFTGTGTQISLISRSIKQLEPFILEVGKALNGIFLDALRFGRSLQAFGAARSVLQGLRDFFIQLRPAITPLLEALANLAKQAGKFGGALGKALASLVIQFSNFLNQIDLVEAFNSIKDAVSVLVPIFRIFRTVFEVLNKVATAFRPAFDALNPVFRTLGNILVELSEGLGPGLAALFRGLADGLKGLIPAARPFGEAMGAIGKAAGPLLRALGPVLANALIVLATAITGILTAAQPLIEIFSEIVREAAIALTPVLIKLASTVIPPLVAAAKQMFLALAPIIPIVARMAASFVDRLLPGLLSIAESFAKDFLPELVKFAKAVGPAFIEVLTAIEPHIPAIADAIVTFARSMLDLTPVIILLIPLMTKLTVLSLKLAVVLINTLVAAIRGVSDFFRGYFRSSMAIGKAAINSVIATFRGARATFFLLVNSARSAINNLIGAIKSIPNKARSALGGTGRLLFQSGKRIIQGLIDGIRSMIGSLIATINNVVASITKRLPFSPAEEGPLSGKGDPAISGAKISTRLASGIKSQIGVIKAAVTEVAKVASFSLSPDLTTNISRAASLGNVLTPTLTPVSQSNNASRFTEEQLIRLITREMRKTLNGLELKMTGVDRVVTKNIGKSTDGYRRGSFA